MSRRCHHGSPRHVRAGRDRRRPGQTEVERRVAPLDPDRGAPPPAPGASLGPSQNEPRQATPAAPAQLQGAVDGDRVTSGAPPVAGRPAGVMRPLAGATTRPTAAGPAVRPSNGGPRPGRPSREAGTGEVEHGATAPQLRRFIKSRAYVPLHELRRRFAINGADDEVTPVDLERRRVFVGLPEREGRLLAELLRGGDIGYELSLDPITPIVVGVYPMRPVTRA